MEAKKKILFLLNIDNYAPEITALTYPFIKRWANRIGAEVYEIKERKWPDYPVVYEKLQIYELASKLGADWIIYIDSDTFVHPDTPDFTEILPPDTVLQNGHDFAPTRFDIDDYFRRDGRMIGTCNWFTIANKMCLDLWKPCDDLTLEEILPRLHLVNTEVNSLVMDDSHLIDDFVLARNVARFGLKYINIPQLLGKYGRNDDAFLYHEYTVTTVEKVVGLKKVIDNLSKK
jgi:hypothetical protein